MNYPLIAAFSAILFAQFIKYPIALLAKKSSPTLSIMTSTGGMPSSHSAAVASLTTALILQNGFSSPLVAIASVFGVIVMFDSMGVRRQSGEQGIILDILARKYMKELESEKFHHPTQDYDESKDDFNPFTLEYKLSNIEEYESMIIRRYLGHKPSEVIVGTFTGAMVATILWIFIG